jgi:hypothetical protein
VKGKHWAGNRGIYAQNARDPVMILTDSTPSKTICPMSLMMYF